MSSEPLGDSVGAQHDDVAGSEINPGHELDGDPDGNRDTEVETNPPTPIVHHPGIKGDADLDFSFHGWSDPVVVVVVTLISPPDESAESEELEDPQADD